MFISSNYYHSVSNKIWDIQNHILDLSIFSVYGHGARFSKQIFLVMAKHVCKKKQKAGRDN